MLEVEGIQVYYGDVPILRNVSLSVSEGEIVTVIGPNGAGKTTLLKAIVNLLPLGRKGEGGGKIFYQGQDLGGLAPEEIVRKGIAVVPEGSRVFPDMSVAENLRLGSYIERAKKQQRDPLDGIFKVFPRLKERLKQKAGTLSGGERQMLAIGRALMARPTLLLLDEPSLGLQPLLVSRVFEAIAEINRQGTSILLVEQNVHRALEISNRGYVLENGRIMLSGKAKELVEDEGIKKYYLWF
jgi:branched-chain amino acid transport system ATP-binding protein